ncbi:MAG: Gfo/Idh/MocA family oxidoreductase [Chloroflexi bacterium]|nr:Gfo/Idh/MocA family oxidoreductase [Chloroflexota bacterium]
MNPVPRPPVRLAILGAGTIGTIHGLCSLQAPEAQVVAVWSRSPVRARVLAERLEAVTCATVKEAVGRDDVDAAVVCTPTFLHRDHALAAIAAGKHVICEKPLARTRAEGEEMIEAAKRAGVGLYVAHVVRFFPEFRRMRELVVGGAIGQPALARMSRAAAFPRGSGDWHNDLAASGGAVLDMGIHDLDWLLWTFGPVKRVYGRGLIEQRRPFLDYGLLTLRFANQAMAHVECSWAEAGGFRVHGELSGDGGLITYDSAEATAFAVSLRRTPETPPGVHVPTTFTAESPYVSQLRHFCRCIRGEDKPVIKPEEALAALRLALAALESISSGRPAEL